jgi:hypothetical protein
MATEIPGLVITLAAGGDLTAAVNQYRPVKMNSTGLITLSGASEDAVGFLQNMPNTGEAATVMVTGVTKALVGTGGVTAGNKVRAVADGVAAAGSGHHVVGTALDSGLAGEYVRVLIISNHVLA